MERYQAIHDRLKQAQSRGMETITNRLDFVVQTLEELIQEAKSSVQGAVPQSADECLPMDEVEEAVEAFRDETDGHRRRADELEARVSALEAEAATGGVSIELLRTLDAARSQSELLREMLPALSETAARAVVLVLRDGTATAWSGIGFADGELLRGWRATATDSPALDRLMEVGRPVVFDPSDDPVFVEWLSGETMPKEVILVPVVLRGKLMGAVYIDHLDDQPWRPDAARMLVVQVCWLIDTLQFRSQAAPALAEPIDLVGVGDEAGPAMESEPALDAPSEIAAEPDITSEPEPEAEPDAPIEPDTADEPEPGTPAVEPVADDPSATMRIDVSGTSFETTEPEPPDVDDEVSELETDRFEPDEPAAPVSDMDADAEFEPEIETAATSFEPEVEPAGAEFEPEEPTIDEGRDAEPPEAESTDADPAEPEPAGPSFGAPVTPPEPEPPSEPATSQFLDEPPPVQPVQPPPDEPEQELSDDEARVEEARRFARLLVSEIKLYNEEQVERGQEARDLYQRLQEDIERSREMFEKRISSDIRAKQDFFRDELVRILADGDPDLLGM